MKKALPRLTSGPAWSAALLAAILLAGALVTLEGGRRQVRYFPMIALNDEAQTDFVVHNPQQRPLRLRLKLRDPNALELVSEEVELGPFETRRLSYSGKEGKAVGGWAELSSDRPFYAVELLLAGPSPWLGVPEAVPSRRFKAFAMVARQGGLQTGLALTNPQGKTARVRLQLRDSSGKLVRRQELSLPPLSNTSS